MVNSKNFELFKHNGPFSSLVKYLIVHLLFQTADDLVAVDVFESYGNNVSYYSNLTWKNSIGIGNISEIKNNQANKNNR